jgi:type VI secretion system secreted protein VgrG
MFNASPHTHLCLNVRDFRHDLQIFSFTGESISAPFYFDLERVRERPDPGIESVLHKQAVLASNYLPPICEACKNGRCLTAGASA